MKKLQTTSTMNKSESGGGISKTNNRPHFGRWNHLYGLWTSALSLDGLPQFDRWIAEEFKKHTKFGSKDRKWYSDHLFAGIRFGYFALFCEFLWAQKNNKDDKAFDFESIVSKFSNQFASFPDVFSAWKITPSERLFYWASRRLSDFQESSLESPEFPEKERASEVYTQARLILDGHSNTLAAQLISSSVPLWFQAYLEKRVKQSDWSVVKTRKFLESQNTRPPLWLRLNHAEKADVLLDELIKEGFEVTRQEQALQVKGVKGIFATEAYRNGIFEIQDLASQHLGNSIKAHPGQLVWDCCSGGGGKTIQIASMLQNKGAVYASDIREYKLDEVRKRARRAGFHNVRCLAWNGETLPEFPLEVRNRKGFDWVLVDAPCSSTGTWRRNPDAKYRVEAGNIVNLSDLQKSILKTASLAVKPGGALVYSTCSWACEENEDITAWFLKTHPDFTLDSQQLFGTPDEDSDTMFAAVLRRKSL